MNDNEGFLYGYEVSTRELKSVSDYTGLNFEEVQNLYFDEFLLLLRDAFIYKCEQSQKGQEYLENCWILEQTTPDRKRLREQFNNER